MQKLGVGLVFATFLHATNVLGQTTEVQTVICDNQPPSIQISQPTLESSTFEDSSPPSVADRIKENLGLSSSKNGDNSFVEPVINWIALIVLVAALLTALFPLFFLGIFGSWFGWQVSELTIATRRGLRVLCVILVVLLGFFLQP